MRALIALAAAGLVALLPPSVQASHLKEQPKKHKVVYHLDEAGSDKAKFVLGNIENHIRGVGGPEHVEAIELVVHGPALRNFVTARLDPALRAALDRLQSQGLAFGACGNTMKAFNITLAELVAIQLGSGMRGRSAVDVAREMLAAYGSLAEVAARDATELARVAGVGPAKAARLVAAFELTRRLRARTPGVRIVLSSPAEVYAAYAPLMEDLKREVFRVALLDAQNGLLRDRVISEGTLSASLVHPCLVFKPAILESAASVILLHNHPSGDPTPSREDIRLTRQLVECARLLELRVHDHLVIGHGRFISLAERGII